MWSFSPSSWGVSQPKGGWSLGFRAYGSSSVAWSHGSTRRESFSGCQKSVTRRQRTKKPTERRRRGRKKGMWPMCVCVLLPIEGGRYCLDGKSTLPRQPRISFVLNVMCVCLCTPRVVLFWRIAHTKKNGSQTLTFPARRMEALHPNPDGGWPRRLYGMEFCLVEKSLLINF